MRWTKAEVDYLLDSWPQGISTGVIGRKLGRKRSSIASKAKRLLLPRRNQPRPEFDLDPLRSTVPVDRDALFYASLFSS